MTAVAAAMFPLRRAKGVTFHRCLAPHMHVRTKWPQRGDAEPSELGYTYASALHEHTLIMATPRLCEALFW